MPQPEYVPILAGDEVRPVERLPAPGHWRADRPGDLHGVRLPGRGFGVPGPDQGYALRLARQMAPRLQLVPGETLADALSGCIGVALKRAALYGRAPVIHDLEHAFTLFGYLGDAPEELTETRRGIFAGAAHHYEEQRRIVDQVPAETLRLTPDEVRARLHDWPDLFEPPPPE